MARRWQSTKRSSFVGPIARAGLLLIAILVWGLCFPELSRAEGVQSKPTTRIVFAQAGIASWYGNQHQGRRTANGERFDLHALTAAHRSLPFGTILRVTNLKTGKAVVVRVNDRGPYIRGRIVDLSAAAGNALGIGKVGIAPVRIEAFASSQTHKQLNATATRRRPSRELKRSCLPSGWSLLSELTLRTRLAFISRGEFVQ
jgi:peptidoglycan lytic transglycosylase